MIGDDVSVVILGVKGNQVRIGVHAPDDVEIHREEIYERVHKEKVHKEKKAHPSAEAPLPEDAPEEH